MKNNYFPFWLSCILIASITIKTFEAAFWIALFCALMHGCTCALGESTILGFLKGFPSKLVGGFGSGTGFAGVFGSGIFLVLKPFMSNGVIFLIVIPLVFVYFINVVLAVRLKNKYSFIEENEQAESRAASVRKSLNEEDEEDQHQKTEGELEGIDIGDDAAQNIQMNLPNLILILRKIGWHIFNLSFVYFLEYAWTTSFADIYSRKIKTKAEKDGEDTSTFFIANAYVILAFWYQIGVFFSRSSLEIVKINRIGIITFLQFINFVFWFINTQLFFLTNYYVMYIWMIFIGLMGGASYVNVMYLIIHSKILKKTEKELAVMVTCIFIDIWVLTATVFALIMANTVWFWE